MSEPINVVTYSAASTLNMGAAAEHIGILAYVPAGGAWGVRKVTGPTVEPLGVIIAADNSAGGDVSIALNGSVCYVVAGAAFTPGTRKICTATNSGRVTPYTNGFANYRVGTVLPQANVASGDLVLFQVNIGNLATV